MTFRDIIVLTKTFHSSGDAIADRRAGYARLLAEGGDFVAAADLISQALDLTPEWVAGWDLLGGYHDKAGNLSGAISAWRHLEGDGGNVRSALHPGARSGMRDGAHGRALAQQGDGA